MIMKLSLASVITRFTCRTCATAAKQEPTTPTHKVVKLKYNDKTLNDLLLQVKNRRNRENKLILLEGRRLVQDAIDAGVSPLRVFFSQTEELKKIDFKSATVELYKTPYKELKMWSDLKTSPGIISVCKKPTEVPVSVNSLPITLVCDQIREPGNLGSLLRNCAGVAVTSVKLVKGCVDPWDPKVLRAGSGAHFRIPIHTHVTWDDLTQDHKNSEVFIAANNPARSLPLPVVEYDSVNLSPEKSIVVVIGGETEGLSSDAFQFANDLDGRQLTIPLSNGVESLNSVSAASVILFELRKHLKSK